MQLFCFGFGYVAKNLGLKLQAEGWVVDGTTRAGGETFAFSETHPLDKQGAAALAGATHVLISIPPETDGIDAVQSLAEKLQGKWIGYLSTTGVYGDWQGEWVDETSPLKTTQTRSIARKQAEMFWHKQGATLFRLGGIYGPQRNALVTLMEGKARRIYKEGQAFSRIHVDDIVAALRAAIEKNVRGEMYNVVDDKPAPQAEVVEYAAKLMSVNPPPLIAFESAELSPMMRSFYAENRRVKNGKLKALLGSELHYPTYKEGLQAEWKAIQSRK